MSSTSASDCGRTPGLRLRPLPRAVRGLLLASAGALLAQAGLPDKAHAAPQGGSVAAGQGRISNPDGATTLVHQQSRSLAINWRSFDVAPNELVQFNQPSPSAAVLNRVLTQSTSQIMGTIRADGQVFIMNGAGVVIGRGARVNVGGLFVSSLDISTDDFMAGRYGFAARDGQTPGAVINRGLIEAARGGSVTLVGGQVANEGVIVADVGHVNLAAGRTATVDFDGDGLIRFEVGGEVLSSATGAGAAVSNSGEIRAGGGQVVLSARVAGQVFDQAVNNSGVIRAGGIHRAGGKVVLTGLGGPVRNTGTIDASGSEGGSVRVVSDTAVAQHGRIAADGAAGRGGAVTLESSGTTIAGGESVTRARSQSARGGQVALLGDRVGVLDGARVDASGATGGGNVRVGGGYRGAEPGVGNARHTHVDPGASLAADATVSGHGGTVVVWSDRVSRFHGEASARGGEAGGDGGWVEVSGKEVLSFAGTVDTRAPQGATGTLLLDPKFIRITAAGGAFANNLFGDDATGTSNISAASLIGAANMANVELQANTDVSIETDVDFTSGAGTAGSNLTVRAGRHVILAGTIPNVGTAGADPGASTGAVTVTMNGGSFTATVDDAGAVSDREAGNAEFFMAPGAGIVTRGGTVSITDGPGGAGAVGAFTIATINTSSPLNDTAGGNITIAAPAAIQTGALSANATLGNAAGGSVAVASTGGALTLGGNVQAMGSGTGAGGSVTLDTTAGGISVQAIDASGGAGAGTTGGAIALNDAGGSAGPVTLNGALTSTGTGAGGHITLGTATVLQNGITISTGAAGGNVTFDGTLASAAGLNRTLGVTAGTGNVTFGGTVGAGAGAALGPVTVSSAGDVHVTGTFDSAGLTQSTGTGTTTIGGVMTLTGGLSVNTGTIDIAAAVGAAGQSVSLTAAQSILDSNAAGTDITAAGATLVATAGGIATATTLETALGTLSATGATGVSIANTGHLTAATLNAAGGAVVLSNTGTITSAGAWTGDSFDIDAGNTITLNHSVTADGGALDLTTSAGNIAINQALTANGLPVIINSAGGITGALAGAISTSALAAATAGGTVNIDANGAIALAGAITTTGSTTGGGGQVDIDATGANPIALASIDASGGGGASSGGGVNLNTAGGAGPVTLNGNLTTSGGTAGGAITAGTALRLASSVTMSTGTTGGAITLNGNVLGNVANTTILTMRSGGIIDVNGAVGPAGNELRAFEITASDQALLNAITVNGALLSDPSAGISVRATSSIVADGVLQTRGATTGKLAIVGGGVTINQPPVVGATDIVLDAGGNDVTVNADLIQASTVSIAANRDIFVQSLVNAMGVTSDVFLQADLDGNGTGGVRVETTGQVIAGRNVVITGSDLAATGAVAGDAVVIEADGLGNQVQADGSVTLQTSGTGIAPAGADIVVNGLVTSTGGGTLLLDADDTGGQVQVSLDLVNVGGIMRFADTLALSGGNRDLTAGTVRLDGGADGGGNNLTVTGNADVNGVVTSVTDLNVTGSANVAANITTAGTQTYQAVTLDGGNPTLSGTTVNLQGPLAGGGNDLTLTGVADIDAGISGVANLQVNGASNIDADISTTGNQVYAGAVVLGSGNRAFTTTGGGVNFASTVNGGGNNLTLTVNGLADIDAAITNVAGLQVNGATSLGGDVTTSASQSYSGALTLSGADRTVVSTGNGAITFGNTVDGPFALAVSTGGATTFAGSVGGGPALTGLATDAGGTTAINGGAVTTTGAQIYNDATSINQATTMRGSALTVSATGSMNAGASALTLRFDDATVNGAIAGAGGIVTFDPRTGGRHVDLGTETAGELSLTAAELTRITAGTLRIGAPGGPANGGISVTGALAPGSGTLALRTAGAVDGAGALSVTNLGVSAAGAVSLPGANNVTSRLAVNAGGAIVISDIGGFTIGTVDSIGGINSGPATTVLTASGGIRQDAGAANAVVAAALELETTGGGGITLGNPGNDVDTLTADADGAIAFTDADDLSVPNGEEVSGNGVTLAAGTTLTLAGDVEGGQATSLTAGNGVTAVTGKIASANLTLDAGAGAANLNRPGGHTVATLAGGGGNLTLVADRTVAVGYNAGGNAVSVRTTAASGGSINGNGTITAGNLTLAAAGGIAGISAAATGNLSLTTAGAGPLGNISVTDVNPGALATSQLTVLATAGSAQVIDLSDAAGFNVDAIQAGVSLTGDVLRLNGTTALNANLVVPAGSAVIINGATVVGAGGASPSGAGSLVFDGAVTSAQTFTVNTGAAAFAGDVSMGPGTALNLNSALTRFTGSSRLVTDALNLGGGAGSVRGPGLLVIERASASAADTTIGGGDALLSSANVSALNGFDGTTLALGGQRTAAPGQFFNNVRVTSALATASDVVVVGRGDVIFESGAGSISTSGARRVTIVALGLPDTATSGNIQDTNPSVLGSTVLSAGTLELLANNRIGSDSSTADGGLLNINAAVESFAQGVDEDARVRNSNFSASNGTSVQEVLDFYRSVRVGGSSVLSGANFSLVSSTPQLLSTPQQTKGELGFIDEGVFLLPPTFTSPERAMLLPLLGDPDFPGDQRPQDPDDDAAWLAFFEDVVRPYAMSRYPLAEDAGAQERAAVQAVVTAELRSVIVFYDAVRDRERRRLAGRAAGEGAAPALPEPGQAPGEGRDPGLPPVPGAPVRQGTVERAPLALGYLGRPWSEGGIGVEPRGWREPRGARRGATVAGG